MSESTPLHRQGKGQNVRVQCVPCGDRYLTFANPETNACSCTDIHSDSKCVFDSSRCDACGATYWESGETLEGTGANGEQTFGSIQDDISAAGPADSPFLQFIVWNDNSTVALMPAYYGVGNTDHKRLNLSVIRWDQATERLTHEGV